MLTDKARAVYQFIVRYTHEHGYPPTIREVGTEFGFKSTNGTRYHLTQLAKAGYVKERAKGKSRAIVPVADLHGKDMDFVSERPERLGHGLRRAALLPKSEGIPILGRVAAGVPLLAEENIEGHMALDDLFPSNRDLFALRVHGQSMRDRGILDGDLVVVRKQEHARDGDDVVAVLGEDATVKTFRRTEDAVELIPANPDFETLRVTEGDDFRVAGVVVGLIRPMGPARRG
ncbi:MAG: transcriptional repressor LexA [Candidatus Eisenbacteria bacterium]